MLMFLVYWRNANTHIIVNNRSSIERIFEQHCKKLPRQLRQTGLFGTLHTAQGHRRRHDHRIVCQEIKMCANPQLFLYCLLFIGTIRAWASILMMPQPRILLGMDARNDFSWWLVCFTAIAYCVVYIFGLLHFQTAWAFFVFRACAKMPLTTWDSPRFLISFWGIMYFLVSIGTLPNCVDVAQCHWKTVPAITFL